MQRRFIIKVTDSTTVGDYKLVVIEADDAQHEGNVALPDVTEVGAEEAKKLAAQYQPRRTLTRFNPETGKEEKVEIPAVNLDQFLEGG